MTPFWYGILVGALWIVFGLACFLTGVFCGSASEEAHRDGTRDFLDEIKRTIREELARK